MAFREGFLKATIMGEDGSRPDQLMDILSDWLVVRQQSDVSGISAFWFQLVWGLCACGQHVSPSSTSVGVLVLAEQLKDKCHIVRISLEEELVLGCITTVS